MVIDKIKGNVSHLGGTLSNLGSNVKDSIAHRHDYGPDEDLISQYHHDIKHLMKALEYIGKLLASLSSKYWPHFFESNVKVAKLFGNSIGHDSLHFKGIDEYYQQFDKFQAEQELPVIHPKEKEFLIESVNIEIFGYVQLMRNLEWSVLEELAAFSDSINIKILDMNKHLKQVLKVMKTRKKKRKRQEKYQKQAEHIAKKKALLDEKDRAKLFAIEDKLSDATKDFSAIDEKMKTILPHVISFLDEFVDSITRLILSKQWYIYNKVYSTIAEYATYHGIASDFGGNLPTYETIVRQWEEAITPTKTQAESDIAIIHDKKPNLVDTEINGDNKKSKGEQLWGNVADKIPKKSRTFKAKDHVNGVFVDYLEADPLDSFVKYYSPNQNRSETYSYHNKVDINDVIVSKDTHILAAPPLPLRLKVSAGMTRHAMVAAMYSAPVRDPVISSSSSLSEIDLSSDEEFDQNDEVNSTSSASSLSASSISSDIPVPRTYAETTDLSLRKIYNSAKNNIKTSPITVNSDLLLTRVKELEVFNKTSSIAYKLKEFNIFFDQLLKISEKRENETRRALYDFSGMEAGDLSFKKGDKIEILFNFQSVELLTVEEQSNWSIGKILAGEHSMRVGFVPNNYLGV
ncbi:uncharacterized protein PRCAT00001649001 [Priceomyces carsonii]|uniref:uncharacterized protein n=1 Tax=Priceomyces carsonii TaxID=28549 RepID=UPI002EDAD151|nr:unnamed protein product [Priceomyces carsonii]